MLNEAAAGKNLCFMTPRAVEAFILQHEVYATPRGA